MPHPWSPYTIPSIFLKASPSNTAIPLTSHQHSLRRRLHRSQTGGLIPVILMPGGWPARIPDQMATAESLSKVRQGFVTRACDR
jgi:hypothetical protein